MSVLHFVQLTEAETELPAIVRIDQIVAAVPRPRAMGRDRNDTCVVLAGYEQWALFVTETPDQVVELINRAPEVDA